MRDIFGKGFLPFETKEPNGIESVTLYDSFFQDLSAFDGVSRLTLKFYQWNLHQIEIKYAESAAQFTNEQLKTKVIEAFNLPPAKWEGSSFYFDTINEILTNTGQELACKDFSVEVVYGNQVRLTNFVTRKMIEENEQKKRENFKP
ncbi:MAG: hypothetical protein LUM44_17860 [Pyrinomonadaceae bacterium]|nr:hypothetical protein [Pyrinomonadaceae bacterium]